MAIQLESEIGTELQLEIDGTDGRSRCTLVGVMPQKLLMISSTEKLSQQLAQEPNPIQVTLRGISRGMAFGFKVPVLRTLNDPEPLLLVAFPTSIQEQSVRKNRRAKCLLPAKFAYDTTGVAGVIADLSNSGCHFQATADLTDQQKQMIQLEQSVHISFALPGKETPKTLEAVIRNTYVSDKTVHVGFEFIDLDSATIKIIDEFIALSFEIQPF